MKPNTHTKTMIYIANTFMSRLKGVNGISNPKQLDMLVIPRCKTIHTFGLKIKSLEIIFFNEEGITKRIAEAKPNRIYNGASGTKHTIEIVHII